LTSDLRPTADQLPTAELGGRRFVFEPHRCFACGELNEHGLHLDLHTDSGGCWTELTLDSRFQGWDDVAHGGILCTILDEVMAWAVIGQDTWGVTARMSVAFRRPVAVGRRLRAEGAVTETTRRLARTEGRLIDVETGELLATGTATYMAAPPERLAELKARYRLRAAGSDTDAPGLGAGRS
jgi:uncharacterized protein (TIGR00369 family)